MKVLKQKWHSPWPCCSSVCQLFHLIFLLITYICSCNICFCDKTNLGHFLKMISKGVYTHQVTFLNTLEVLWSSRLYLICRLFSKMSFLFNLGLFWHRVEFYSKLLDLWNSYWICGIYTWVLNKIRLDFVWQFKEQKIG